MFFVFSDGAPSISLLNQICFKKSFQRLIASWLFYILTTKLQLNIKAWAVEVLTLHYAVAW